MLGRTAPVILFLVLIGILAEVDIQSVKAASQTHPVIGTSWIAMPSYKDAYVNSSSPDTNFGDDTRLYVGAHFFTFVAFNLSVVPSGAMIVSALMRLDLTWTPGSTYAYGVDTYYCSNSSWSESGITWNNMPTNPLEYTDDWHIPYWYGGGYKTFNVTKDVRTALSSGNLTEVLKLSGGNDVEEWGFGSREEKQRGTPSLEVEYAIEPIYVVQFESVAADFPDNIGFVTITYQNRTYKDNSYNTTFANYTFMLPADIEIVSGDSLSVYYRGYVFVRWEASGDVVVSDANVSTTTLNASGNGTLRAVGNADIMEYSYDCGTSAYGSYGDSGEIEALRFTPLCSGRLRFAYFYIDGLDWNSTDNRFKVHVMDENRSDIMIPFEVKPASLGWLEIDLSTYELNVTDSTDFYIGMERMASSSLSIGISHTPYVPDRGWSWNGTTWLNGRDPYMIRAVIEHWINAPPVATLSVSNLTLSVNQYITFNASASYDPDGQVESYFFDFGDGSYSSWTSSPIITHLYSTQGIYNATVTVKDNRGVANTNFVVVEMIVVPEFSSFLILSLFMMAILLAVMFCRRKHNGSIARY